jgi:hypothetical protein
MPPEWLRRQKAKGPKMTRNLKVLGLAAAVVLAMSAVAASGASGKIQFKASQYSKTGVVAKEDPTITLSGGSILCKVLQLEGKLTEPSSTMSVAPTFTECTAFGLAMTAKMNGCEYLIHANEHVSTDTYAALLDLVCPAGKTAEIQIPSISCTITFLPATGYSGLKLKNNTNEAPKADDIAVSGSVGKMKYEYHGFFCPDNTVAHADGIIHMENQKTGEPITLTANAGKESVDLEVGTVGT